MAIRDDIRFYVDCQPPAVSADPVSSPELPQWDGQIYVCRVCPRAVAKLWRDAEKDGGVDERAQLAVEAACDQSGSRIFQAEDVLWLSSTPYLMPLVERLYAAAREHNGLTEENRRGWRKNSSGTGGSGLPCSSAAPS
jgi:hypothetical protein